MSLFDLLNLYAHLMRLRRWLYRRGILRSVAIGLPVISVGNLSMGGTGKSPIVMRLAEYLMRKGKRVAIVSRGYKRKTKGLLVVSDGRQIRASPEASGDEPMMFALRLPGAIVVVDEDRVRGGQHAKKLGAEIIILDDGAQHLRIQRDLDIMLFDARRPLPSTIPFGRGREPFAAVRDAGAVLFTHAEEKRHLRLMWDLVQPYLAKGTKAAAVTFKPDKLTLMNGEELELAGLSGMRVMALASVASPKRFVGMLEAAGAEVSLRDLGDHAAYSQALVSTLLADAERSGIGMIITTEKDFAKCREYFERAQSGVRVAVLSQRVEFLTGAEGFYQAVDRL